MRGSLDVLDVGLLRGGNTAIGELLVADAVFTIHALAGSLPVPVHAAGELQAGHLLVGQVRDDLEHVTTVAIDAEDVLLDEVRLPEALLEQERTANERPNCPLCLHGIFVEKSLHFQLI